MYATIDPNRPLSDAVAAAANAEDIFEKQGIDYWFGWNQPLRAACADARVDPQDVVFRLVARDELPRDRSNQTLVALFSELDQQFDFRLEPAIRRARKAAPSPDALHLIELIEKMLDSHTMTVRRMLSPVAAALDLGAQTPVDAQIVRHLALQHSVLAVRARELYEEAARGEGTEFAEAARALVREIHQHIKISYNFILPRLTAATRPVPGVEPW